MRLPSNMHIDDASWPLLQGLLSYVGVTSGDGDAGGTTVVDAALADEPSYDGLTIKILSGNAAGQARTVQYHPGSNTITVGVAFTDSVGAVVQIVTGTRFMVLTSMVGGGGPGPSPEESLTYYGIVSAVPGANQFTIPALAGLGASKFLGANPYWAFVLRDAGGAGAAPQGELQPLTAYTTATGVFTSTAFTAAVGVGDEILIIHSALAAALIAGWLVTGTLTTSSATVPADTGRTEANDYWNGSWLMTLTGAVRMQPRLIVDFANAGGVFTLDAEQPFTAAPGLVAYVILPPNSQLVPAANSTNNQTPAHVLGNKTDAATLDDMSALATASIVAEIKRTLIRMSADAFTATIQGAARTELDTMLAQMATYFVVAGAALSVTIDPGGAARASLALLWNDLGQMLAGGAGITTWPAAAAPADGVSFAEAIRQIYNDIVAINSGLQELADTAVNITAIAAGETNVFDLSVAATRYVVRSLRLKCADPGANTVSIRLYELVNDVSTVVTTFTIDTNNFGNYFSLMDLFGIPHLAGDNLKVTVQASAGGPYAVTGQYSYATAT